MLNWQTELLCFRVEMGVVSGREEGEAEVEVKEEGEWDPFLWLTLSSAYKSVPVFQESRILSGFD